MGGTDECFSCLWPRSQCSLVCCITQPSLGLKTFTWRMDIGLRNAKWILIQCQSASCILLTGRRKGIFKRWAQHSASVPFLVLLAHVSICSLTHSYAKALDRPAHRLDAVKDTQTQITQTFLFFGCSVGEGFRYKWPLSYGRIITRSMRATQANLWPFFSCQIPGQLPTEEFLPADRLRLKPFECLP